MDFDDVMTTLCGFVLCFIGLCLCAILVAITYASFHTLIANGGYLGTRICN